MAYTLTSDPSVVLRDEDGAFIPDDPANVDYQEFCRWAEEGGVPTPYTPPPAIKEPTPKRQAG